jgi:hypoxanthine phosphoribosyltransferase
MLNKYWITGKLSGKDPLVLCVLNGALIPTGHLLTRLNFTLRHDYIHATRYRGGTSGAELEWIGRPSTTLKDEIVLVIDDILDQGVTLSAIVDACKEAGAKAVYSAVLVEKRHDKGNGFKADFIGLMVEDRYVFGYGMDYMGYHRNASGIFAVAEN